MTVAQRRKPFRSYSPLITDNSDLAREMQEIARLLNPLLASPFAPGNAEYARVTLTNGLNKIDHGLERAPAGFFLDVDLDGAFGDISNAQGQNTRPEKQLWINYTNATDTVANIIIYAAPTRGRDRTTNPTE